MWIKRISQSKLRNIMTISLRMSLTWMISLFQWASPKHSKNFLRKKWRREQVVASRLSSPSHLFKIKGRSSWSEKALKSRSLQWRDMKNPTGIILITLRRIKKRQNLIRTGRVQPQAKWLAPSRRPRRLTIVLWAPRSLTSTNGVRWTMIMMSLRMWDLLQGPTRWRPPSHSWLEELAKLVELVSQARPPRRQFGSKIWRQLPMITAWAKTFYTIKAWARTRSHLMTSKVLRKGLVNRAKTSRTHILIIKRKTKSFLKMIRKMSCQTKSKRKKTIGLILWKRCFTKSHLNPISAVSRSSSSKRSSLTNSRGC